MTKYHYYIRDGPNNVLHDSKKGVAKKGFDDIILASKDGDLIAEMKYPGVPTYTHVYAEEQEMRIGDPVLQAEARSAALLAVPIEQGEVTGGPIKVTMRALFEEGYETGYMKGYLVGAKLRWTKIDGASLPKERGIVLCKGGEIKEGPVNRIYELAPTICIGYILNSDLLSLAK